MNPDTMPSIADLVDLSGRRALVTGGSRGIGAAIVARLVEAGASVTIADLTPPESMPTSPSQAAGQATGDAAGHEPSVSFVECDITNADQLAHAFGEAAGGGGLDISVHNAGIFPTTGPIEAVTDDFVARMLEVNVRAQFSAMREAAAAMSAGGAIVNMASIAGLRGGAHISAYAASKAAVVSMTHAHAIELGPKGVRVNAIAPGIIDTPGVQAQMEPLRASGVDVDARIAANPLRIAGAADHVARTALFLVSDLAAFVSGHVVVVDGASTA